MIWAAYAVLCVLQLLCVHSDCIIVFQPSLAVKRSLDSLDRLPPALRGVKHLPIAFQLGLTAKHMLFILFGPFTARVARRVSVPQLY